MPLLTRDETAMDEGGLLQEASCGFLRRGKEERGKALLLFLPFIKPAHL